MTEGDDGDGRLGRVLLKQLVVIMVFLVSSQLTLVQVHAHPPALMPAGLWPDDSRHLGFLQQDNHQSRGDEVEVSLEFDKLGASLVGVEQRSARVPHTHEVDGSIPSPATRSAKGEALFTLGAYVSSHSVDPDYVIPHHERQALMDLAGIARADQEDAEYIIQKESSWRPFVHNANSSAYGLAQRMLSVHPIQKDDLYMTEAADQLLWANNYAIDRYGGWSEARVFWEVNNYW